MITVLNGCDPQSHMAQATTRRREVGPAASRAVGPAGSAAAGAVGVVTSLTVAAWGRHGNAPRDK